MKNKSGAFLIPVVVAVVYFLMGPGGAGRYNNKIVRYKDQAENGLVKYLEALREGIPDIMLNRLKQFTDRSEDNLAKLEEMSDYKGNTGLRDSAVRILEFYVSIAKDECVKVINIMAEDRVTDAMIDEADEIINEFLAREDALLDELIRAQEEFAEEFDLTLKE